MARGRPVEQIVEAPPRKFTREFKSYNDSSQKWHYDLDKNPNGPFMVEVFYSDNYVCDVDDDESLPKTKRKYFNPKNGKMVAYTRAKELKII